MKTLAVTGGIGCGKSHIVDMFAAMGVPVYFTDDKAKGLYDTSESLISAIRDILGTEVVENGRLRKDIMAQKLFGDRELLKRVESVVHPAVIEDFKQWRDAQSRKNAPFVIIESAIFLEIPLLRETADKVLVVTAPVELRVERVQRRSNLTAEQILERMSHQWSDAQRLEFADYNIVSDESKALLPQVINIFNEMSYGNR